MFKQAYKGRRVLVTGHTGFKGSWLCLWLKSLGAEVRGLSLYVPSDPSLFELSSLSKDFPFVPQDVCDLAGLKKTLDEFRPEIVFHLAAEAIVRACYDDPLKAFRTNTLGTATMLEACRSSASVKALVCITSDKCYENVEWEYGYRESDRLGGKDPYSASKACAELAFSAMTRSYYAGPESALCVSVRAGNVIGGGDWARDRIVPDCVRAWSQGKAPEVRNPAFTRPWQHVLEPLSGYLHLGSLLLRGEQKYRGESYNFGPRNDRDYSVGNLIEEMQKTWKGNKINIALHNPDSARKEAGLLKLSCDKAFFHLKWLSVMDFPETIQMTTSWYKGFYQERVPAEHLTGHDIDTYQKLARERGIVWALD